MFLTIFNVSFAYVFYFVIINIIVKEEIIEICQNIYISEK